MPQSTQGQLAVPSGIGSGGGGGGSSGVAEVTDGTNVATGNVKLVGASGTTVVVTPGANGTATITGQGVQPNWIVYKPSGDATYATDTAALRAIQTAQGSNPYLILLDVGAYYIAGEGLEIFGRQQGIIGLGAFLSTINYQGLTTNGICIQYYDSSFDASASLAAPCGGFSIYANNSQTDGVLLQVGNLLGNRVWDVSLYDANGPGSIGLYLHNGAGYSEEGEFRKIKVVGCTSGVVIDTGSWDYNKFEFLVIAAVNQHGVLIQNGAALGGTHFELGGNFNAGATNTGIVFGVDANGGGSGTSQLSGFVNILVECDGSGTGHQAYNFGGGSASQIQGVGQFRFVSAPANFAAGVSNFQTFAFTGQVSVPAGSSIGSMTGGTIGQGVGQVTIGGTLKNQQGTAINPLYLGTADLFYSGLGSGANTLSFTQVPTYSQEIEILLIQPASGARGTVIWPNNVYFDGPGTLSPENNANDFVKLRYYPNYSSWYGTIKLNVGGGGIVTTAQALYTVNVPTVTAGAVTVPISSCVNNVVVSATTAITMATTGAIDGQFSEVRITDGGTGETLSWVNTENSTVSAPLTSPASATLPTTVLFQFNGGTTKWRCVASV